MIKKTVCYSRFDTAVMLRLRLGGKVRSNWESFLEDCVKGHGKIKGRRLMPIATVHDGMVARPKYSIEDIEAFIAFVLAEVPGAGPEPFEKVILPIDSTNGLPYHKFDKDLKLKKHRIATISKCRSNCFYRRKSVIGD